MNIKSVSVGLGAIFLIALIFNYNNFGKTFLNEVAGDSAYEYCMKSSHVKMLSLLTKKKVACDCAIKKIIIAVESGLENYQLKIALKKTSLGLLFTSSEENFISFIAPKMKSAGPKCALKVASQ